MRYTHTPHTHTHTYTQFVDFATFAPMSAACNTTPILFEIFTRLETVFKVRRRQRETEKESERKREGERNVNSKVLEER